METNELKVVSYYNENGNVKAGVRNGFKAQGVQMLLGELEAIDFMAIPNARGGISIPVATDSDTGDTIYMEIEVKVNTLDPDTAKKKAKKKATKTETDSGKTIVFYSAKN